MTAYLQRIGKSLMLPVAVLPVAAIFMGIGYWIDPSGWGANNVLSAFLIKAGGAVVDQMPILFAVGIGLGMSKDKDGASALSGLVAFLIVTSLLKTETVAMFQHIDVTKVNPAFGKVNTQAIGIVCGLIGAGAYNKFSATKLPTALSFFSGKRLAPIMSAFFAIIASAILFFMWPMFYSGLVAFGKSIVSLGALGAGIYGFFNRLLIPTGLHHALNSVFWFDVAGISDITKFWAGDGVKGVTGMYQAGFFPVMMFGLPAGAFAMYRNARPEKRKQTASLFLAAGFASFFTGVTEPLEFSFMFVAWPLYVMHAILTGISLFISATMHWIAGFTFSAGLVDFILSFRLPLANQPYMLIVQGLAMAAVYYFSFDFAIKKFNLMTPGREEGEDETDLDLDTTIGQEKYQTLATRILFGLGGVENIKTIDNCATRLRLEMHDNTKVDEAQVKKAGVAGVRVLAGNNVQVIVGPDVQFVADELSKFKAGAPVPTLTKTIKTEEKNDTKVFGSVALSSVVNGELHELPDLEDGVFSSKMMGDGFYITPSDGTIYAPVSGKVTTIFPTKHAIGFQTENGAEVLLHMGVDTVQLKGEPFEILVSEGEKVTAETVVASVDLAKLKEAGKKDAMIVVVTNSGEHSTRKNEPQNGAKVVAKDVILTVKA